MADPTFCSVVEVGYKAGAGKSATAAAEAYVLAYAKGVESYINSVTRYNWSDAYAALNVAVKYILNEIQSNLTAMYVIMYDTSGYTGNGEVQAMLNVLWDRAQECIKLLQDIKVRDFMEAA